MSDEQMQHPDAVDDAFRQAERQLDAKIEALRQAALGNSSASTQSSGTSTGWSTGVAQKRSWDDDDSSAPLEWEEASFMPAVEKADSYTEESSSAGQANAEWDDAVMRPTGSSDPSVGSTAYVDTAGYDEVEEYEEFEVSAFDPDTTSPAPADSAFTPDNEFEADPVSPSAPEPARPRMYQPPAPAVSPDAFRFGSDNDQLAHLRTSLRAIQQGTDEIRHTLAPQVTSSVVDQMEGILRDELSAPSAGIRQIQAQLPAVEDRIARAVGEELEAPVAAMNQLQEELPIEMQRIQRQLTTSLDEGLAPVQTDVAHVRDRVGGIDTQLDQLRAALGELDAAIGEDLTRSSSQLEGRIGQAQVAIREDLDRSERAVTDRVDGLAGDMQADLARFGSGVREGLSRVESSLKDEIAVPAAVIRQLHDEMPAQLQRLERVVRDTNAAPQVEQLLDSTAAQREQLLDAIDRSATRTLSAVTEASDVVTSEVEKLVQTVTREGENSSAALERQAEAIRKATDEAAARTERVVREEIAETTRNVRSIVELDLGGLFTDLMMASRATIDKLSSMDAELSRDRVQRAEDLELTIDALTAGFSGMQKTYVRLVEAIESVDNRVAGLERYLASFDKMSERFDAATDRMCAKVELDLGAMREHLTELQPAPVVVTVAHPEARVEQTTRGGLLGKESGTASSK